MSKKRLLFSICLVFCWLLTDQVLAQQQFTMEHFIGVNLRREDPAQYTNCAGFVRDYHDWNIDEGDYYNTNPSPSADYPNNKYRWNPGYQGQTSEQFDGFYLTMRNAMFPTSPPAIQPICASMKNSLPSLAGGNVFGSFSEFKPVKTNKFKRVMPMDGWEKTSQPFDIMPENELGVYTWSALTEPVSYRRYSDWVYQFTKRYGSNTSTTNQKLAIGEPVGAGLNRVGYVEIWNEQDKWWIGGGGPAASCNDPLSSNWLRMTKFCPDEYAAMASTAFDGHNNTITAQNGTGGATYTLGTKNADTNMKYVFGGLSEIDVNCWDYVTQVKTWCTNNRTAGTNQFPFQVLNFHHYSDSKWDGLRNDGGGGVAPELDTWLGKTFRQRLVEIKDLRNTNFPGKELWLSEFGYDSNEASAQRVPTFATADRQEVQGQWLVRSYLEIAYAGWDRAMQFCIRDNDSYYKGTTTFQSSGLVLDKANNFAPKKSYYYVSAMREALRGTKYDGDESPVDGSMRVYRFKNTGTNQYVYAIWSPTASDTKKLNYTFTPTAVVATSATQIELYPGDFDGRKSSSVDQPTVISVVSGAVALKGNRQLERPVFVKINVNENEAVVNFCATANLTASGVSCDGIKVTWAALAGADSYQVYYYEKNDSEESAAPSFNLGDSAMKLYAANLPGNSTGTLVSGLKITDDKYYIFVRAVVVTGGNRRLSDPCLAGGTSSTLSCDLNNISVSSVVTTPAFAGTSAGKMFNYNYLTPCNPARDQYNTDFTNDGWVNESTPTPAPVNTATVTFSANHQVESIQVLDGAGVGRLQIFVTGQPTPVVDYVTSEYGVWKTFPVNIPSVNSFTIVRTIEGPTINRIIFKGKPVSGSYATACCAGGAGYLTIGSSATSNTLLSSLIPGSLPSGTATDKKIIVNGTLTIDPGAAMSNTYTFNSSRFYMQPGAKIVIQNQKTLQIQAQSALDGCAQMWNGIELAAGGKLNLDNATIRDAQRGVNVLRAAVVPATPTLLTLTKAVFEKNYYGVYVGSNTITADFSAMSSVNKSFFDGNETDMKPCFSGQTECATRSYIGMYVHSATLNVGGASYDPVLMRVIPVQFRELQTAGIYSVSTALTVRNTLVDKINGEDNGSYGIYQYKGTLDQEGFGSGDDKQVSFRRMWYPIAVQEANFTIKNNRMEPESWGIWVYKGGTSVGVITDNYIDNKITGIEVQDISIYGVRMLRNQIFGNRKNYYAGISCSNYGISSNATLEIGSDMDADMNQIWTQQGVFGTTPKAAGISLSNIKDARIKRNRIDFTQYDQTIPTYGIYLSGGSGNIVDKNRFKGITEGSTPPNYNYSPANYGLYAVNSSANMISCNLSDGCKYGLTFEGTCTQLNGISGNQLNKYAVGLQVLANSTIGPQNYTGNRWEVIAVGNHDKAAKNQATDVTSSVIRVRQNESQVDPYPSIQPSAGWFIRDPAGTVPAACAPAMLKPDESAAAEFDENPTLAYLRELRLLNLSDPAGTFRQLAQGQLNNSGLSPATLWVMKRQALREIEDLLGPVPTDNVLKTFVESQQPSSVGAFHRLDQDLRTLQQGDAVQMARRQQLVRQIKLHQDSLNVEAKNWQQLSFNAQALLAKSRNETGADRSYHLQLAEYNALMDAKIATAKLQANELKAKNAAIPVATLYEKHEQTVNAIYIETALLGNKITPEQTQTLKDIAMLCPDVAGEASQKARIVYGFYYALPLPQWGPCGAQVQEDIEDRGYVPSLQTAVKVYPVPTTTDLMVSGAYSATQQRHYQVVNLLGEVILAGQVTDPVQQISVGSFPSGMYYMRVLEDDRLVAVKKFNVQH